MSYEHFSVEPVNRSADNVYGFSQSNSVIQFSLPTTDAFLVGDSLKVCFKFLAYTSNGQPIQASNVAVVSLDAGLNTLFSTVDVGSYESGGLSFETIRQYPRMVSSLLTNGFSNRGQVFGGQSHAGVAFNTDYQRTNTGTQNGIAKSYTTKLYSGFLMGNKVLLSSSRDGGVGGLRITIQLVNDSFLFQDSPGQNNAGLNYKISDLRLRGIMIRPSAEEKMAKKLKSDFVVNYSNMVMSAENRRVGSAEIDSAWSRQQELGSSSNPAPYNYNTINGYIATIASDNNSVSLNVNLGNAISAYGSFIKSTDLNSQTADSGATFFLEDSNDNAQPLTNLRFSRGGILYPIMYDLETNAASTLIGESVESSDTQAEIYVNGVNGTMPFKDNDNVLGSVYYGLTNENEYMNVSENDHVTPKNATIGVRFSSIEGTGANFRDKPLQVNIDSVNNGGDAVNHTLFLYVINRQSLVYENGLMRVIS
jgi:hypothetical protein